MLTDTVTDEERLWLSVAVMSHCPYAAELHCRFLEESQGPCCYTSAVLRTRLPWLVWARRLKNELIAKEMREDG